MAHIAVESDLFIDMMQAFTALQYAAYIDCPRTEAWKNLLDKCRSVTTQAEESIMVPQS